MTHEEDLMHKRMKKLLKNTEERNEEWQPVVTFKNYADMCKRLNLPVKKGTNSKNGQLKYLRNFCNITRAEANYNYYYTEVYADPDRNMINSRLVVKCLEGILLSNFIRMRQENQACTILMSQNQFMKLLSFVNSYYGNEKEEQRFLNDTHMSEIQLSHFKVRVRERFEETILPALDTLKDRMLIDYSRTFIIIYDEAYDRTWKYRAADADEISRILNYKKQAAAQCGCDSMKEIWQRNLWTEYYKKFDRQVQDNESWLFVVSGYRVVMNNEKWLRDGFKRTIDDLQLSHQINQEFIEILQRNAERKYHNYQQGLENDVDQYFRIYTNREKAKTHLPRYIFQHCYMEDNYLTNQRMLTDYFIDTTHQ